MRVTNTERTFCFEMTVDQMRRILRRDGIANERAYRESMRKSCRAGSRSLASILLGLATVREVEYDGMFGPCIWIRIEAPEFMEPNYMETVKRAQQVIEDYIARRI